VRTPSEHIFGKWVEVMKPTVDDEGLRERTCAVCGLKESRTIPRSLAAATDGGPKEPSEGIPTVVIVLAVSFIGVALSVTVLVLVKRRISK
jgi:hypothetical protein